MLLALTPIGERSYKLAGYQSRMSRSASSSASLTGPPPDAPLAALLSTLCWPEHRCAGIPCISTSNSTGNAGTDRKPGSSAEAPSASAVKTPLIFKPTYTCRYPAAHVATKP